MLMLNLSKILRKIIALSLSFTMLLSINGVIPVVAADVMEEDDVSQLFNEMTENIALALLSDDLEDVSKYESKISQIEEQLAELGVKKLSEAEVDILLENNENVSARVSQPESTDTVTWFLQSYEDYEYNSEIYDVQRLIAVGKNPGGLLVTGEDNAKIYSGQELLANAVTTAVSIYVQKAIGLIPIYGWTPYELLFSNSPSNVFNSNYVTHRCVSTIVFTYVKKASQTEDAYSLSFFSNSITFAIHAHGASVVDSVPSTYSVEKTETVSSDNYSLIPSAIQAYNGNRGRYDYITSYVIESYDGKYSKTISVPNPQVGPGQIY